MTCTLSIRRAALALAAFTLTAASASAADLTGRWICFGNDPRFDTATYFMTQAGEDLFWFGRKDAKAPGEPWANVAHGRFNPATRAYDLAWSDVPLDGPARNHGFISVRYVRADRDKLLVEGEPGRFGTKFCIR